MRRLGISALVALSALGALAQPASARLTPSDARLAALVVADNVDNRLYRHGYLTQRDHSASPHLEYDVDAEMTDPRRNSASSYRLRVYFYDGDSSRDRFIGLAQVVVRADRRRGVVASYGWLKQPIRPPVP